MSIEDNEYFNLDNNTMINVVRFTKPIWDISYKNYDIPWGMISSPNSLYCFLDIQQMMIDEQYGPLYDNIPMRIITLDEEYIQWLHGRENNMSNRLMYCNTISNEDALRLANKNGFDCSYTVCYYPFIFLKDDIIKYKNPNKRLIKSLEKYISKMVEGMRVSVAPFLVDMKHAAELNNEIVDIMKPSFDNEEIHVPKKFKRVNIKNHEEFVIAGIPIVFKEVHNTMVFRHEDVFTGDSSSLQILGNMVFDSQGLTWNRIDNVKPFHETDLPEQIKNTINIEVDSKILFDFLVAVWDCEEFYTEISHSIIQKVAEIKDNSFVINLTDNTTKRLGINRKLDAKYTE